MQNQESRRVAQKKGEENQGTTREKQQTAGNDVHGRGEKKLKAQKSF